MASLDFLALTTLLEPLFPPLTSLTPKGLAVSLPRVLFLAMMWWRKCRLSPRTLSTCPLTWARLLGRNGLVIRKLQQNLLPIGGLTFSPVLGNKLRMVRVKMRVAERCRMVKFLGLLV